MILDNLILLYKCLFTAGEKLPWNVRTTNVSVYTVHTLCTVYYLLHPMGMAATLGVTASNLTPSTTRPSLGLCIHADMQAVLFSCSQPQVRFCVTASNPTPSATRPSLGLCIHADMQAVLFRCSQPQVRH